MIHGPFSDVSVDERHFTETILCVMIHVYIYLSQSLIISIKNVIFFNKLAKLRDMQIIFLINSTPAVVYLCFVFSLSVAAPESITEEGE